MSVPEGWEKHPIGKICKSIVPGRNKPKSFDGTIPWITTPDIQGRYLPSKAQRNFISETAIKESGAKIVPAGGVVIAAVGELGLTAIAAEPIVLNQQLHAFICTDNIYNEYLAYWLETQKPYMDSVASKTTIPYMNKSNCESIPVIFPLLPEQKKIVRILSTWDRAIEVAEKLLNNSRQQKKALMQQLLTGKKRLPGFNGKWKKVNIGNVVHIASGKSKSKFINENGERYIIDMGSISREGKLIPSKKTDLDEDYLLHEQLVMPKDDIGGGNIIGRVGFIDQDRKYVLGDHVYALYVHGCDSLFLCYLINHDTVNKSLRRKANGTAQLGLGKKDVEKQPVYIPNTKEEQQKIASVLSAANKEIEILEQKLGCLRQEKKALMQQLLTGKRRVKVDGSEAPEKEAARA